MLRAIFSVGVTKTGAMALALAATLLSVRLITEKFGLESYGAVSLVSTLVALMPVADLGLSLAVTNIAARFTVTLSSARLRLSLSTMVWLLSSIGLVMFFVSVALGLLGAWDEILGPVSLILGDPNLYMPPYILMCGIWITTSPVYRLLTGLKRVNTLSMIQATGPVLALLLNLVAIVAEAPLLLLAYFPLIGSITASLIGWMLVGRRLGWSRYRTIRPGRIARSRYSSTLRAGLSGMPFALAGATMYAFDRLLLSQGSSPSQLAIYAASIPLFTAAQQGLSSLGAFLWPHYTALRHRGLLAGRTLALHTIAFAGLGVLLGCAIYFGYPLYLWVIGVRVQAIEVALSISLVVIIQAALLPITSALTRIREIRIQGIAMLVAFGAKISIAIWLIPHLGAAGPLYAGLIAVLLAQVPTVVWLGWHSFGRPPAADRTRAG